MPTIATTFVPLPPPRIRGIDDAPTAGERAYVCAAPKPAHEPFARDEHRKRDELAARLQGDRDVRGLMDRWATLPGKDRFALARRVSAIMGEVYGFAPAPMRLVSDKQADGAYGSFEEKPGPLGRIVLNSKKMMGNGPEVLTAFVDTVVHEQTHRYQVHLMDRLKAGELPPGHPHRAFAQAMLAGERKYHEPADDEDKQPAKERRYRCQISERHAWNNAAGVMDRLMKLRAVRFEARA